MEFFGIGLSSTIYSLAILLVLLKPMVCIYLLSALNIMGTSLSSLLIEVEPVDIFAHFQCITMIIIKDPHVSQEFQELS